RLEQAPDAVLGCVLNARGSLVARHMEQVAVQTDELGQRDRLDRSALEDRGAPKVTARGIDLCERVERVDITRERPQRGAQVNGRSTEASTRELELAELRLRPGVRLLFVCRGVTCEQQRTAGAVEVPLELTRIGDARVRGDARLEACHRVEGGERRA